MRQEVAKYIKRQVERISGRRKSQEVKAQLPFSSQPESTLPNVYTVLEPILMGGSTIGERGFQRLSDVTLRHHLRAKLDEAQQEGARLQNPSYEDFGKDTGQEWEIHRRVSLYPVPVAQSDIWFPDLHTHTQDWSVFYMGGPEENIKITFGAKMLGTREFMGLDIPNEITFDFRFFKGRDGQDEYIEIVVNNKLFVLDKTGTMLDASVIDRWAAAHGWRPSSEASSDPVERELQAFFGDVTAIGWHDGPDQEPKAIEGPSSS